MKKRFAALILLMSITLNLQAVCYLRVEKAGSYDPALVNENAIAHISAFVEKVNALPPEGIKVEETCLYNLNIVEDERGIIVTVNGNQLNGSGDSRLRGFDGFQQALLRAIAKSKPDQRGRVCAAYPALMKEQCQGLEVADYAITTRRLASNPQAAKKYKIALIFEKRGKPDKTAALFSEILKTYPGTLEAAYIQMHAMGKELKVHRQDKQFNTKLFNSILLINDSYKSTSLYNTLKVDSNKWLSELVEKNRQTGHYDQDLFSAILRVNQGKAKTSLINKLIEQTIQWQVVLGERVLGENDGEVLAQRYFENAEKLGISNQQIKTLNDKLKAAKIRTMMRKGQRDEAEMAIVTWEVDEPDSTILAVLKKEFDRPDNMITIPQGKVNHRWVGAFNLDKYEVTNAQFLEFVKENPQYRKSNMTSDRNDKDYLQRWRGDLKVPHDIKKIPVVFVSQIVATAYCEWLGKRLPTNLEWGLAAGQGKRNYPWGNSPPNDKRANYNKGLFGAPKHGDSHPAGATPEGIMHMAGNVWEWTSTIKGSEGIARGGCYFDQESLLHNENKSMTGDPPTYSSRFTGFRCAK